MTKAATQTLDPNQPVTVGILTDILTQMFAAQDAKFEKRFDEMQSYVDQHFSAIDQRFSAVDERFESMQAYMDEQFSAISDTIQGLINHMDERFDRLERMHGQRLNQQAAEIDGIKAWQAIVGKKVGFEPL